MKTALQSIVLAVLALAGFASSSRAETPAEAIHLPVVFSGGYDTDPRDHGRPVILVAGALGVPPDVFRDAFSRVHPAGPNAGGPTPDEARQNKAALMAVLGPLGITNDRLDAVSNYYRYNKSKGEMWKTKPAVAYAVVENGTITSFVVTDAGAGYSSPPKVTVAGFTGITPTVQLAFGKAFEENGSISAIQLPPTK